MHVSCIKNLQIVKGIGLHVETHKKAHHHLVRL